jgi:hypothetical protein
MKTAITIAALALSLSSATAGENWYALVAELQTKNLDAVDRRFVDWMANHLTATDVEIKPTRKQQRWLLDIKRRNP